MDRPDPARPPRPPGHVPGADAAVVRGYARAAADLLGRGPLTLADRDRLLKRGERLGLGRFDANLVLAAVEHKARQTPPALRIGPADAGPESPVCPQWTAATAAVVLQVVIASGAWWLLA